MRALSICLGLALSLGLLVGDSKASITITRSTTDMLANNPGNALYTAETFSNNTENFRGSGNKSVTFTAADFNNHPTAEIISIEVAIEFSKIGSGSSLNPYYNEIQMIFSKDATTTTLIAPGGPQSQAPNGFNVGPFRNSFDPPIGFDGTVVFRSAAADDSPATERVNFDAFVIPESGKYLPAAAAPAQGQTLAPWENFLGQSAIGTFTLNIGDIEMAEANSPDPLVFRNMTITVTAVPEPSSFAAVGLLTVAGAFIRRRRARG